MSHTEGTDELDASVTDLRTGRVYIGDAAHLLNEIDFASRALQHEFRATATTPVMREVSTALAGATYELEDPQFGVVVRRDEHGCTRITIDISEAE